jgi:uncharacterized protein YicC (UPF0701 family)
MSQIALQSMTGFGKANGHFNDKKISIEVRSLNSKGLDLNLKIPSSYRDLETPIRKLVTEKLLRGKMDLYRKPTAANSRFDQRANGNRLF